MRDINGSMQIELERNETKKLVPLFIKFIRERLGIVVQEKNKDLEKVINEACINFQCNPAEYLNMLIASEDGSILLNHLIAGITIGETYFFRDKRQMELLKEIVLPQLVKKKRQENNLSLRIWSAGSSSGEELYTIAMLLDELIPDQRNWNIKLLGTDINSKVLAKGMRGSYTEWSMRSIPEYYKKRYFKHEKNEYIIDKQLRERVTFLYLNLNDNNYPSVFNGTNAQDLIFCRNVLIYFDNQSIKKLMQKINASLVPGGFLFLGASDPICIENTDFDFHPEKCGLFARKSEQEIKVEIPMPVVTKRESIIIKKPKHIPVTPRAVHFDRKKYHKQITALMEDSKWADALHLIQQHQNDIKQDTLVLNAEAIALANLGKLEQSLHVCQKSLEIDSTQKFIYLTYALTLAELDRLSESETALRKLLFLDREFVVGHFQLGLLLMRKNFAESGLKSLKNALNIAKTKQASEIVVGSQGLNYGRFVEILEHEIELYNVRG